MQGRRFWNENRRYLDLKQYSAQLASTMLGESYCVPSTMFQATRQASHVTTPVSWGYNHTDGALGHGNTRRVVGLKQVAHFHQTIVRTVSAGNRSSLLLTEKLFNKSTSIWARWQSHFSVWTLIHYTRWLEDVGTDRDPAGRCTK